MRMLQAMREIQFAVDDLRAKTEPLLGELRESVEEARDDLDRFDRVLGSAEAISSRVEGASQGGPRRAVDARDQDRRTGHRHRKGRIAGWGGGADDPEARHVVRRGGGGRSRREHVRPPKTRQAWERMQPTNVAKMAAVKARGAGRSVVDAVREGRSAMKDKEAELREVQDLRLTPQPATANHADVHRGGRGHARRRVPPPQHRPAPPQSRALIALTAG